jgi:hypothetical protein
MSAAEHEPAGSRPHGPSVRSEEDRIPSLRIVLVGIAALFVFFVGSLITVGYERARREAYGPYVIPPEIGQNKIGLVEQQIFDLAVRGERSRAKQLEELGSTGWVDRGAGVAHIPIEDAMRLVVEGVRSGRVAGGAPPPGGQP